MSHVLIAWELGSNYGHLARLLPIATRLRERGHRVTFAVRDTGTAAELLTPAGFTFLQAPLAQRRPRLARAQASYAEMLLGAGYADGVSLSGLVRAWLAMLRMLGVDAVLADHAPTALFAARLAGTPGLAIGSGFSVPPGTIPLPSILPWEEIPETRLREAGQTVDAVIAAVAERLGHRDSISLQDLFGLDALLGTFAELDHYGERPSGNYIGPIFGLADATPVAWQAREGRKIVAYMRPDVPGFAELMVALRAVDAEKFRIVPGLAPGNARRLADRRMRIAVKPVALGALLVEADLAVSYGGSGMTATVLLAGVPMLLVPRFVEQYLGARRVEALGAGVLADGREEPARLRWGLTDPPGRSRPWRMRPSVCREICRIFAASGRRAGGRCRGKVSGGTGSAQPVEGVELMAESARFPSRRRRPRSRP